MQWGIDQQFYRWASSAPRRPRRQIESGYPYPTIRTGGEVVTDREPQEVAGRTDIWLAKAQEYGFM